MIHREPSLYICGSAHGYGYGYGFGQRSGPPHSRPAYYDGSGFKRHIWGRGARLYLGACAQCKSITRLLPAPILLVARARAVGGGIRHYAVARTGFLPLTHSASSSRARRSITLTPASLIRINLFSPPCSPSRRSVASVVSSLFRLSRLCLGK